MAPASPRPFLLKPEWIWALGLFTGLLAFNSFLVSPFIGWYDSGEMVGATACLGISHPSGQVLFHLLGKLFLLLPLSTPAFRLGLLSAACSALASALFFVLSCKLAFRVAPPDSFRRQLTPVLIGWLLLLTLAWSLSLPWWRYSLAPLVYALHLLLGLLLIWVLSLEKPSKWILAFFILGLATVFRPTQFFALPFVLAAFGWERRRKMKGWSKLLVFLILAFLLGRSTGLYLPLRSALHPAIAYADLTHPVALFQHVFALKFSKYVGTISLSTVLSVLRRMAGHFWTDWTPLGLGLVLAGLVQLGWKREKIPAFLWVALAWGAVEAAFVFTIPFPTFESHQVLLGWVYWGFLAVLPLAWAEQILRKGQYGTLKVMSWMALIGFFLVQLLGLGDTLARKGERGAQDYARNLLEIMEPNALYFPAEENEYFPVVGVQQAFQFRRDIEVIEPGTTPGLVGPQIAEGLRQGRPLYVTRQWPLPPGWVFRSVGPLLRVVAPGPVSAVKVPVGNLPWVQWGKIGLVGAALSPAQVRAGGRIEMTLEWVRPSASPCDQSDSVVVLFSDEQGNYWMKDGVFWLHDIHEAPVEALRMVKPGYAYLEKRILFIPSDFPTGHYRLMVGLQKKAPPPQEGQESFGREFYDRSGIQNLDKFLGRGETGAVVQFSGASDKSLAGDNLWPITKSVYFLKNPCFAPVAWLAVEKPVTP